MTLAPPTPLIVFMTTFQNWGNPVQRQFEGNVDLGGNTYIRVFQRNIFLLRLNV